MSLLRTDTDWKRYDPTILYNPTVDEPSRKMWSFVRWSDQPRAVQLEWDEVSVSKSGMSGGGSSNAQLPRNTWKLLIAPSPVPKPWPQASDVIDLGLVAEGQRPLATSRYDANLQMGILGISQASQEGLRVVATPPSGDPLVIVSMFPTQLAISDLSELEVTEPLAEEREQGRLANKLHAEFEAEVLQDGERHPAEDLIQEALRTSQERVVLRWFETWAVDASQPSFAASVLRCLGRQGRFGTDSWRTELIRKALSVDDVDIRDAAVQAVESWEDQELIQVLRGHDEPEHWLKDYIQGVIFDLTH